MIHTCVCIFYMYGCMEQPLQVVPNTFSVIHAWKTIIIGFTLQALKKNRAALDKMPES